VAVTADPQVVRAADRIVLPGVGAFKACVEALARCAGDGRGHGRARAGRRRAVPGHLRGHAVLMADRGIEFGVTEGLGWIGGEVRPIERTDPAIKVPHMGWNDVEPMHHSPLIVPGEAYFLHSYHFVPTSGASAAAMTDHGGGLVAAVAQGNVLASSSIRKRARTTGLRCWNASWSGSLELPSVDDGWWPHRTSPEWGGACCGSVQGWGLSMIVFPAIDLKAGQVVRLAEGDMARATVYGDDPAAQATLFAEAGSQFLHVVDLRRAFAGEAVNREAVEGILKVFSGHVQLGGGIRNPLAVDGWFDLGVSRVVIGTAALKHPQFVKDMAKAYPGGIVVAVDARDGMVATEGWGGSVRRFDCRYGAAVRRCGCGLDPVHRRGPRRAAERLQYRRDARSGNAAPGCR